MTESDQDDTITLEKLKTTAEEVLKEEYAEHMEANEYYLEDIIHEVADGTVPVYNHDLLELANNSPVVALEEPRLPTKDNTVIDLIKVKTYEEIDQHLREWINKDENQEIKEKFRE
jgi:hypothetical protein